MPGHYLRVQEAASLLGVAPPTIRWYCSQGLLPTYWIGRGQTGHRRFSYADVAALGAHLGRSVPPEKTWDLASPWNLKRIAEYLGLSDKFLISTGAAASAVELSWPELQDLERRIYGDHPDKAEEERADNMNQEQEAMADGNGHEHAHRHGRGHRQHCHCQDPQHRGDRGPGFGPRNGAGRPPMFGAWASQMNWQNAMTPPVDPTDLLALKSAKRHLEAQREDLEDQIAELTRQIETHPDHES